MKGKPNPLIVGGCFLAALMAVIAVGEWPYGYYTLLRVVVCTASVAAVWALFSQKSMFMAALLLGVAVLFNPIAPIHLDRATWALIDIMTGLVLFGAGVRIVSAPTTTSDKSE